MRYALLLFVCLSAYAQETPVVALNDGCGNAPCQKVYGYSGTNLIYTCSARSIDDSRQATALSISAATNANPVVLTSTGHGFSLPSNSGGSEKPRITIRGGTGNWTAINGSFVATIIDANTFSIPVNSTSLGALAGTVTFVSAAPRLGIDDWGVKLFGYDSSSNLIWSGWLNGRATRNKCSDAALTTIAVQ